MANNKIVGPVPATQAAVACVSASELLVAALRKQLADVSNIALYRSGAATIDPTGSFALVLIDLGSIPIDECLELFKTLHQTPVALVNANHDAALLLMEKYPWIKGVFYRSCSRAVFEQGMEKLVSGGDWLPRALMERLVDRYRHLARSYDVVSQLSKREKQILFLAGQGLSNVDIANRIHLSIHTVKTHVHKALRKLGAANRTQAASMVLGHAGNSL